MGLQCLPCSYCAYTLCVLYVVAQWFLIITLHVYFVCPEMSSNMQQQQLRPQYPQAYTGFNSCRMGAMQAQRMISMQNFNPDSFNVPLDGITQPGKLEDVFNFSYGMSGQNIIWGRLQIMSTKRGEGGGSQKLTRTFYSL